MIDAKTDDGDDEDDMMGYECWRRRRRSGSRKNKLVVKVTMKIVICLDTLYYGSKPLWPYL